MLLLTPNSQPQNKVDHNSREQRNGQNGRTKSVIKATLASETNTPRAPMESEQGIHHGHHGNEGKQAGGDFTNLVAEVEEADCQTAEDDGEIEP